MRNKTIALILIPISVLSQKDDDIRNYIDQYKRIAIEEMVKFGIPASVTIAQGIHESSAGKSKLAQNSNNHFGIKCHKDWNGSGYRHDDDAPQECFRVYNNPEDSYKDHSQFLLSRAWYKPLFLLSILDYKGWAYGLKKAGYATNPKYPEIIIGLIEKYQLHVFDTMERKRIDTIVPCGKIRIINGAKAILYNDSLPIENLCACCGISTLNLYLYNDVDVRHSFKNEEILFIEPKKTSCNTCSFNITERTTYKQLSQQLGIQLWALFKYNGEKEDRALIQGETINLCEKQKDENKNKGYVVKQGDSLYSIARQKNTSVERLKEKNKLKDEKISIGQQILID